jgi:hypothetical protein
MARYNKRTSKERRRHDRTGKQTAKGGRDRNNECVLTLSKSDAKTLTETREEIVIAVQRTETPLRKSDVHIYSTMRDRSGISRLRLEIWRLRRVRVCIGRARCPL